LFDRQTSEPAERSSYQLFRATELELKTAPKALPVISKKSRAKPQPVKYDVPSSSPDQVSGDIMVCQDRNGVLFARRKALEKQRDLMNNDHVALMERGVHQKVRLKLEIQNLKAQLAEVLARSKSILAGQHEEHAANGLIDLNGEILQRVTGFRIALKNDSFLFERYVMVSNADGETFRTDICPFGSSHKFHTNSHQHPKEVSIYPATYSEHDRNNQLQKEARQLGDELREGIQALVRTNSGKLSKRKDGILPSVRPVSAFIAEVHVKLQELINRYRGS
jgi:hypothetical protein